MAAKVKVIDRGIGQVVADAAALAGSGVKVGFQAGQGSVDGVDALNIAIWNEFGTTNEDGSQHIPPRPMVRNAAIKYEGDVKKIMAHLAKKVVEGASVDEALGTLGEAYQARQIAHIRSGEFAPNAASTIKRKGSSVPLVDEGRVLVPAVRYEIIK